MGLIPSRCACALRSLWSVQNILCLELLTYCHIIDSGELLENVRRGTDRSLAAMNRRICTGPFWLTHSRGQVRQVFENALWSDWDRECPEWMPISSFRSSRGMLHSILLDRDPQGRVFHRNSTGSRYANRKAAQRFVSPPVSTMPVSATSAVSEVSLVEYPR